MVEADVYILNTDVSSYFFFKQVHAQWSTLIFMTVYRTYFYLGPVVLFLRIWVLHMILAPFLKTVLREGKSLVLVSFFLGKKIRIGIVGLF